MGKEGLRVGLGAQSLERDKIQNSSLHANEDPKVTHRAAFYRANSHGAPEAQDG